VFYGAEQARIHDSAFGVLAATAATDVLDLLRAGSHDRGLVVDLGCGSGILARVVIDAGYDALGVDISSDMVTLARDRAPTGDFRVGSLHDLAIPDGCIAVCAIGEALNYATDARAGLDAFRQLAQRAFEALAAGGVFLFDVSGPGRSGPSRSMQRFHRYDQWCLGMIASESDDGSRLDREISIFTVEADGRYLRSDEHHVLRLFDPTTLVTILGDIGYEVEVLDNYVSQGSHPALPGWYVVRARKV
jgi:SAM-dependent methyltransferase